MFSLFLLCLFSFTDSSVLWCWGKPWAECRKEVTCHYVTLKQKRFISLIMKLVIADSLTERVGFKKEGKNSSNGFYALLVLFPSFVWGKIVMKWHLEEYSDSLRIQHKPFIPAFVASCILHCVLIRFEAYTCSAFLLRQTGIWELYWTLICK